MEKNFLKVMCACIVVVMIGVMMSGCGRNNGNAPTYDRVRIDLTEEAIASGKVYTLDDFTEIDIIYIKVVSPGRTLWLTLREPGRQNVLHAIELLEQRKDVESARTSTMVSLRPTFWNSRTIRVQYGVALLVIIAGVVGFIAILYYHRKTGDTDEENLK